MQDQLSPSTPAASPGDPYCGHCGYLLKGLEDSARCPECGKPIVEVLMRREFARPAAKRYRSKATLFGLPVIDVAIGPIGQEKRGKARGIIAIGDLASGWIAIGGIAQGIVAIGGLAIGVFAVGGLTVGLLTAMGGAALSTGIAGGGGTVGSISLGGLAIGIIAQGGLAAGMFARGGLAFGKPFPAALKHFVWLFGNYPPRGFDAYLPIFFTLAPGIFFALLIGLVAIVKIDRSKSDDPADLTP